MEQFLEDPKVPLRYFPIMREYALLLRYSTDIQLVCNCPWCGKGLPTSLRDEYFDILEKEYNVYPALDFQNDPYVPVDFKSDVWWKKRGL
jgi:hypothetical protein